jgi:hypothetical protein
MSRTKSVTQIPQMQDMFPIAPEFPTVLIDDVTKRLVELEIVVDYYRRVIAKLTELPVDLYVMEFSSPISVHRGISIKMIL